MKMVMISADDYEKLSNAKKESETKIESYKQCIAGYESRIKELTEERDKLKDVSFDMYKKLAADNKRLAKSVLNSAYGAEQDICCRISKNINTITASMFNKISELSDENEKLKKEYVDLNNAYKSQKNELLKLKNKPYDDLKHKLEDTACTVARIYNNANESYKVLETLAYDLRDYM